MADNEDVRFGKMCNAPSELKMKEEYLRALGSVFYPPTYQGGL